MVTTKKVVKRRPPPDWKRAVDDIIRKKRALKFILLHTCEKGEEFAVNPDLIWEVGNKREEEEETPKDEDKVRIVQSQVTGTHEARLHLAEANRFRVGDTVKFSGLTRITKLNGVSAKITATSSSSKSGYQVTIGMEPGDDGRVLVVHNYSTSFTVIPLAAETGFVYVPEHKIKCGFVTCCCEDKIETVEAMEDILVMIIRAGIGTVFDPKGDISKRASESIG